MGGQLIFQTVGLEEAARGLGLDRLGITAFPILGAIIPNCDWGTALRGVGQVAALDIVKSLQRLAYPPEGLGMQPQLVTPRLVRRNAAAVL